MNQKRKIRVLIIDDDFSIREVLKKLVSRTLGNVSIQTTDNGIKGIGLVEILNPDLIIVDSTLPEFAGAEVVSSIKQKEGFTNARKIVLLHQDSNFPKLNEPSILRFNKNDNSFVEQLVDYLSFTFSIQVEAPYRHTLQNVIIKKTLNVSNRCDILIEKISKKRSLVNPLNWLYWLINQVYLSFLLTVFYIFTGGKIKEAKEHNNKELLAYRVRYYPTITTIIVGLFILVFQLGAFIASGFAVLQYNLNQLVAQTSCPLPVAPDVINNSITVTPDNVDGIIDCESLDIIVGSTGEIIMDRYVSANGSTSGDWGVTLLVNNLTVMPGGKISANGKGYTILESESVNGKGGDSAGQTGGAGGGHGGAGGQGVEDSNNPSGFGGVAYGNNETPTTLGSAGGSGGGSSNAYQRFWSLAEHFNRNGASFTTGIASAPSGGIELLSSNIPDVVTQGLSAWYKMDEEFWTSGQSSVVDSINGINATVSGANANTIDGYLGRAGNFSNSSYISLGNNFNPGISNWTYSFWIKTSQSSRFDFGKRAGNTSADSYGLIMSFNQGSLGFTQFRVGNELLNFNFNFSNNEWHMVTFIRDASNSSLRAYINGQFVGEALNTSVDSIENSAPFYMARASDGLYFTGQLDDFRIYNRVLNQQEITDLYTYVGGEEYNEGEQIWTSELIDAEGLESIKLSSINVDWELDGSDNVAPKFQILASSSGTFGGEEIVFPAIDEYYQVGGSYNIQDGVNLDLSSQITSYYKYYKVRAILDTGSNLFDTPRINSIQIEGDALQVGTAVGGAGGGSIKIVSTGTVTINGSITANGLDGQAAGITSGGGGAGGSIWIEAPIFGGNGIVEAKGGSAAEVQYQGGGGGGGRLVMLCSATNGFTGTASVAPGITANSQDGGIGTIIGPTCRPNNPSLMKQFKSNQITEIPENGITTETTILFATNLSDVDTSDTLALQIELKEIGQPFTGIPTHTQSTNFSNPQVCNNNAVNCGKILVSNLTRSKEYHWQARVRDNKGGYSYWVSFGTNLNGQRDVLVTGNPSVIQYISGNTQSGVVNTDLLQELRVRIVDSVGFPVPGYSVNWSVINGGSGGQLTTGSSITDNDGYSYRNYKLGQKVGNNVVRASGSGLTGSPVDFTFTSTPDVVSKFTVVAPQFAITNQQFGPVVITVYDQFDNVKTDYTGSPSVAAVKALDNSASIGTLTPNTVTFTAPDNGVLSLSSFAHSQIESIKIRVQDGAASGFSNSIAIVDSLGSCPDVDGIIDSNQTWTANLSNMGIFDCRNVPTVLVTAGSTLALVSYNNGNTNWTDDFGTTILANDIQIDASSKISANATGYGQNRGGGSYGVYGGYAYNNTGTPYGSVYEPKDLGSSGGGGAIKLVVGGLFTNNGVVESNGATNTSGTGGSIWIDTDAIAGSGTITANAGTNGDYRAINGSGGRVAIYYNTDNSTILNTLGTPTPKVQAQSTGCTCDWTPQPSGPGTIYLEEKDLDAPKEGSLYVRNVYSWNTTHRAAIVQANETGITRFKFKNLNLTNYGHLDIVGQTSELLVSTSTGLTGDTTTPKLSPKGTFIYDGIDELAVSGVDLTIDGKMELINSNSFTVGGSIAGKVTLNARTWYYSNLNEHIYGNINVLANGTLNLVSYNSGDTNWTNDYGLNLNVDNLSITSGGVVNSNGTGYGQNRGGGSYGVYGGYAYNNTGTPYGSVYEPKDLGSSGGGGAIKLTVGNTLLNNGKIESNGAANTSGSGGSVWVDTDIIAGSGTITANAGTNGDYRAINGSGGRVAIYYNTDNSGILNTLGTANPKVQAESTGCTCNWVPQPSGPGTIYIEEKDNDISKQGSLYVRNVFSNNTNHRAAIIQANESGISEFVFKQAVLTNYGHLDVVGQTSIINLTAGDKLTGDSTTPKLVVSGTLRYSGSNTLIISGTDVTINGKIELVNGDDVTIGGSLAGKLTLYANTWYYNNVNRYLFGDVSVTGNGTLNLVSYNNGDSNWTNDYGFELNATNLTVATGGIVSSNGSGYGQNRGGGSYGVYGGYAYNNTGTPYGSVYEPKDLGSSGGGGAIKLVISNTLTNNGIIESNGIANTSGSGGSVWIDTNIIAGTGTITANAGTNGDYRAINGSGGRVAIYYNTDNSGILNTLGTANPKVQAESTGCTCNWVPQPSGPGTIYIEEKDNDVSKQGSLYVRNVFSNNTDHRAAIIQANESGISEFVFKQVTLTNYGHLDVVGQTSIINLTAGDKLTGDSTTPKLVVSGTLRYSGSNTLIISGTDVTINGKIELVNGDDVTIGGSLAGKLTLYANTWYYNNVNRYLFGDVSVTGNGTLNLRSYDNGDGNWTNDYGFELNATNLTVATGGIVSSNGSGYGQNRGGGSQGVHGGYASNGSGTPYGSLYEPKDLGSSGGGGAIKLVISNTLTNNGIIESNGIANTSGSGGSVWIDTNIIAGTGTITANAGTNGDYRAINGSGGRVAIYYNADNSSILNTLGTSNPKVQAQSTGCDCDWTPYPSGPGTIYIEEKDTDISKQGSLYVRNVYTLNKSKTATIDLTSESGIERFIFKKVDLTNYGNLTVVGDNSVFRLLQSNALSGDTTLSSLIIRGTIEYTGEQPLVINGLDITIRGKMDLANNNIQVGETLAGGLTLYANTWFYNKDNQYTFDSITVNSNGILNLISYNSGDSDWTNDYGTTLTLNNLTVLTGGKVSSSGTGYSQNRGGGSQGVYGGYASDESGTPYGNLYKPIDLGSSSGGGAIKLIVNNELNNNGSIESNGAANTVGSGGSVWVDTNIISGNGTITANAGINSDYRATNGSGGRVALYYNTDNSGILSTMGTATQKIEARSQGCRCAWVPYPSGPGTVYIEHKGVVEPEKGDLYIHNNGADGRAINLDSKDYYFNNVYIGERVKIVLSQDLFALRSNETISEGGNVENMGDALALWNFEEQSDDSCSSGADYCDASGNNRHLTSFGSQRNPSGKVGKALELTGNNYAEVDLSTLNVNSFTVGMWAKLNQFTADSEQAEELINFNNISTTSSLDLDGNRNLRFEWPSKLVAGIVSQGKTATQSSTYAGYPASNCFDGDVNNLCHSNVQSSNDWVQVDLGSVQNINKVDIWNRADCCQSRFTSFKIEVSNTGTFSGEQVEVVNLSNQNVGRPGSYSFNAVNARYVRVTKLNYEWLNLAEIQVYATSNYLPDNQWQHIVATYNSSTGIRRIYVDGIEQVSQNQGTNYTLPITKISIGKGGLGSSTGFVGLIDEVFVYPRELTQAEINIYKNTYSWNEYNNKRGRGPVLNLTGNFTLKTNSLLTAKGLGFPSESGLGRGLNGQGQSGGAGGGHGGTGGTGQSDGGNPSPTGGLFYGSQRTPLTLGSGGGKAGPGAAGGAGGGAFALRVRSGDVSIEGVIDVSGENGKTSSPGGGGGAGGSILVEGQTCNITGTLNAQGGNGGDDSFDGGGGGGGRISILYTQGPCNATGTVTVANGTSAGGQSGQVGTYPTITSIPSTPSFKDQFKTDGETSIPVGGVTSEQTVKLKASVSDPGANISEPRNLVAEFEVVGVNESFTAANILRGRIVPEYKNKIFAGIFNSPSYEFAGGDPLVAEVDVTGLQPGAGYKWRARVVNDDNSIVGSWTEFGNNSTSQSDFVVANTVAMEIIPNKTTVIVGETISLNVNAKDSNNNNDITYRGTVFFTSNPSSNSILPSNYTYSSQDNGTRQFINQVSFSQPGIYTITVTDTVASSLTATTQQITVNLPPAAINSLEITPSKTTVVQGEALSVEVRAYDQYSQIFGTYNGTVTFGSTAGNTAILPGNYTFTNGNNGINTFNNSVIFNQIGTYTVTVTDIANSSLTATTTQITVNPAVVDLSIIPNKIEVIAGEPITLNVQAINSQNTVDTYYRGSVTFTSTAGEDAVLPSNYSFVSNDSGNKDFTNGLVFTKQGIYTVTVTDINNNSLSAESVEIIVNPPPPQSDATSLELESNKIEVFVGEPITLTVSAKDINGENVEDYYSTIRFLSSASPDVTLPVNYQFNVADAGVRVFENGAVFLKDGEFTITARDILYDTLTDSVTIKVNKSTQSLRIFPDRTSIRVGESVNLTVRALNSQNIEDIYYRGTVRFSSTSPTAVLPFNYTFVEGDLGIRTFTSGARFSQPGIFTVSVQDTITDSLQATTVNIVVNPVNICESEPNNLICLADVEITDVKTQQINPTTQTVCWKTNVSTIGYIQYGLAVDQTFTNSTDVEDQYLENHCLTIDNLIPNTQYIFRINATSNYGKSDTADDTFVTMPEEEDLPEVEIIPVSEIKQCIVDFDNYSFNSDGKLLINYKTDERSVCKVHYGNDPQNLEFSYSENSRLSRHIAEIDLSKLDGQRDLFYKIDCVNIERTCISNSVVPVSRYLPYYPNTTSLENITSGVIPALLTVATIATGALNIITYPGLILYAFPWFNNRRRKSTWGVIFDEKTKNPIPFATIRIYDEIGKFQKQLVTGFDGKYGFLVNKGNYILEVKHADYNKEKFEIKIYEDEGIAAKNIGLTKLAFKKNTVANKVNKLREKLKKSLPEINKYIVLVGFVIATIAMIVSPNIVNLVIIIIYTIQILILILLKNRKREWGYVYDSENLKRIKSASVRVFDINQGRQIDIQLTDEEGRFGFKLKEGEYYLQANAYGYELNVDRISKRYTRFNSPTGQILIKVSVKKGEQINILFPMRRSNEVLGKFAM